MDTPVVVGLGADLKLIEPHPYHCVGDKYLRAVAQWANAVPVIVPALSDSVAVERYLDLLDGLVLTGSYSNMHPRHYGETELPDDPSLRDPARDDLSLALIKAAIRRAIPTFAICRGFQEVNVAFGGSLHQMLENVPGIFDHLEDKNASLSEQYAPSHRVSFSDGGYLQRLTGQPDAIVNSLHGQGVNKLGSGLSCEAVADDGLIEAFTVDNSPGFALAVQWHPEWQPADNPFYQVLWQAFGDACRDHKQSKSHHQVA